MKRANRVITPLLALCAFPVLYYMPILNVFVSSSIAGTGNDGTVSNLLTQFLGLKQLMSVNYLVNFMKDETHRKFFDTLFGGNSDIDMASIIPSAKWLTVFAVFAVLAIVFIAAVVLIPLVTCAVEGVVAAKNKDKTVFRMTRDGANRMNIVLIVFSVLGAAALFMMNFSFDKFAAPFLSGEINAGSIIDALGISNALNSAGGDLSSLIGPFLAMLGGSNKLLSFDAMALSSAYTFSVLLMIVAAITSVAAQISGDPRGTKYYIPGAKTKKGDK